MELEILKHTIITIIGNIVTYFLLAILISWIISACFNIRNEMMPFGWVKKVFQGLTPIFKWIGSKLQLLLKILFKWIVYGLEQLFILVVDLLRKLLDLLRNPDD